MEPSHIKGSYLNGNRALVIFFEKFQSCDRIMVTYTLYCVLQFSIRYFIY